MAKGRSHLLIRHKPNKNGREANMGIYEEEDKSENPKGQEIASLKDEVLKLTHALSGKDDLAKRHDEYADLLNELFKRVIITSEGEFIEDDESAELDGTSSTAQHAFKIIFKSKALLHYLLKIAISWFIPLTNIYRLLINLS